MNTAAIEKIFIDAVGNGSLSHAYVFFGPSPEKEKIALKIANFLENGNFAESVLPFVDLKILKNDKINVNDIREIKSFIFEKPFKSKRRTVIIAPFENLTREAEPALLKITEEPPQNSLLIFIGQDLSALNSALSSRVLKIFFSCPNPGIMKPKNTSLESELESLIINLYSEDPRKNASKIKILLDKKAELARFNLNEKIQKKFIEKII